MVELLVEAMGGDVGEFRRLWLVAGAPGGASTSPGAGIAGRTRELEMVRGHLEAGTGLLLVSGEAGIGKTKLIDTASATTDVLVGRGAGLPLSSEVPFLPMTSVLRGLLGNLPMSEVLSTCPAYVRGAVASLLPELDSEDVQPAGLEGSARPRLFSAVQTLLEAAAQRRQVAVLIDDLHWADKDTLDLLEHLLVAGVGVPVVGAFRTEDPAVPGSALDWAIRLRRLWNVDTLDLPPMTQAETAEQIGLLPGPHPRTPEEVGHIYARSLGRPLFTEQLAADAEGPLPALLDDLLGRRVMALPADEQHVVSALGVADRGLPVEVLQAVSGLTPDPLVAALRELDRRRLLADSDGVTVSLRHPLLAEAVRRHLVPGEAAELHRRLARGFSPGGEPAEVAAHWQAAGDPEQELGWRIRAARLAQERIATAEEARQWRRALELWVAGGDLDEREGLRRVDAEIALLDALHYSGQDEQAWEAVQPLLNRVDHLSPLVAAEVLYRAAIYGLGMAGGPAPIEQAARAVELFKTAPPSHGLLTALEVYSRCQAFSGQLAESWETGRQLIDTCRSLGYTLELGRALTAHASHLSLSGWTSEIREVLDEAHRLEPSPPDPVNAIYLGTHETDIILKFGGTTTELVAAGREALDAAEEWGLSPDHAAGVRYNIALGLLWAGRVRQAADLVDGSTQGPPTVQSMYPHALRVALDAVRGWPDEAAARLTATQAAAHAARRETELNAIVTDSQLWSGRAEAAFDRLTDVLQADNEVGKFDPIMGGACQILAVRAAADLADDEPGRRDELRHRVTNLLGRADFVTDNPSQAQHAYRHARAAELSRLTGQPQPQEWASAAAEWDRINRPFDAAYCRWRGAQAALSTGQAGLGQRMLRRAAHQAREHVSLSAAIQRAMTDAATATHPPASPPTQR